MEHILFSSFSEKDFDEIIFDAGGKRYTDNLNIQELNCDYVLDDAVIELKIIEEEPIHKKQKQKKFIDLFANNYETVILYPSEEQKNEYFKILESPIQNALKKASKQLKKSANKIDARLKIAIIMNNGLYMVSQDEFREMAIRRAKNDTSGIDILIICSIYYYSDGFDSQVLFPFEDNEINEITYQNKKIIIDKLKNAWGKKIDKYMTKQIVDRNLDRNKQPIQDLFFEDNGIRYIKPNLPPRQSSKFFPNGRHREDTTKESDLLLTIAKLIFDEKDIQRLTNIKDEMIYKTIKDEMTEYQENLEYNNCILVETHEIGIDKANDISFISYIDNSSMQEYFVRGKRMKYEYAIDLAIFFCIIQKAKKVYFFRNEDYKWK